MDHKKLLLALRFYRGTLMVPGIVISCIFGGFVISVGPNPVQLFLLRSVPVAGVIYFIATFKKREFAYYRNLGLPRMALLGLGALYDFIAALIIIVPFYVAR